MKTVQVVFGNTYFHKEKIRILGFRWCDEERVWVRFTNQDDPSSNDLVREKIQALDGLIIREVEADDFIGTSVDPIATEEEKRTPGKSWRDSLPKVEKKEEAKVDYSFAPGETIQITTWLAKKLRSQFRIEYVFRNLKIIEMLGESEKAIRVKFRFESKVADICHVCGRALDTAISMATGIGPTCAKNLGISRTSSMDAKDILKGIEEHVKSIGTLGPAWLAKSQMIKLFSAPIVQDDSKKCILRKNTKSTAQRK